MIETKNKWFNSLDDKEKKAVECLIDFLLGSDEEANEKTLHYIETESLFFTGNDGKKYLWLLVVEDASQRIVNVETGEYFDGEAKAKELGLY